jgi:RNA polymerase sigma-70 factor (ECF subfamily)
MSRAQDGDRGAYERLLHEVAALVRDFVRRRVRRTDGLEDIVQETLLCIHRDRRTYDPARPFCPWMYAIARHRLLDHVARQRRTSATEVGGRDDLDHLGAPEPVAPERGLPGLLHKLLAHLSGRQREVIQMLKVEGFSVAEISRQTVVAGLAGVGVGRLVLAARIRPRPRPAASPR